MHKPGFTMVELLVVVLIVVILAGILYPTSQRTGCDERGYYCQTNLKQIALGIHQYRADYDNWLPPAKLATSPGIGRPYGWVDAVQPYLRSFVVLQCPSEEAAPKPPPSPAFWRGAQDPGLTDYWINGRLCESDCLKIPRPANTILLGDGNDGRERCDARYALRSLPEAWRTAAGSPARRHRKGANYAFVDGHVKWLKPEAVSDGLAGEKEFGFQPGPFFQGRSAS